MAKQMQQTREQIHNKESTNNIATSSYFNTKRRDALKLSKTDSSEDTIAIMESHMTFPCVFVEALGVTFIYPDFSEDSVPIYILVNSNTNSSKISVGDAMPGMNFVEIKRILGEKEMKKTWTPSEEITTYALEYIINGYKFSFQSNQENGEASELYISEL
jgi:hypothetical protein